MEETPTPSRTVVMFLAKYDADGEYILHKEFNLLAGKTDFEEGPYIDESKWIAITKEGLGSRGIVKKQVYGMLKDGRCVWSEFKL